MTTRRHKWLLWLGSFVFLLGLVVLFFPPIETNRIAANESRAVGHLRHLFLAQAAFQTQHGCFASELSNLSDPYIDDAYSYKLEPRTATEKGCVTKYVVTASPKVLRKDGMRYFSIEETGVLRLEQLHPVGPDSPALQ